MVDKSYATARPGDPITSHLAAARVAASHLEQDVYNILMLHRPRYMTSVEIAKIMGIDKWSVSPRLKPLWVKGWLADPIKIAAPNSAGKIRLMQAWRAK